MVSSPYEWYQLSGYTSGLRTINMQLNAYLVYQVFIQIILKINPENSGDEQSKLVVAMDSNKLHIILQYSYDCKLLKLQFL